MASFNHLAKRRLRQQCLRLAAGRAARRCRELYPSDFVVLEEALCKVRWKVENTWCLTLEPVPVPM